MANYSLKPKPLSKHNFADYGEVIDTKKHKDILEINYGMTKRYNRLANLDLLQNNGQPLFSIFMSKFVTFPFRAKVIERHPLSSQLFFPLGEQPFLILVSKPGNPPTPEYHELFITNGSQGINYNRNTWHYYLLAIERSANFIVIDRGGEEDNCDEFFFTDHIIIENFNH